MIHLPRSWVLAVVVMMAISACGGSDDGAATTTEAAAAPASTAEPAPTTSVAEFTTEPAPTTTVAPSTTEPAPTTTEPAPTTTVAPSTTEPAATTSEPAPVTTMNDQMPTGATGDFCIDVRGFVGSSFGLLFIVSLPGSKDEAPQLMEAIDELGPALAASAPEALRQDMADMDVYMRAVVDALENVDLNDTEAVGAALEGIDVGIELDDPERDARMNAALEEECGFDTESIVDDFMGDDGGDDEEQGSAARPDQPLSFKTFDAYCDRFADLAVALRGEPTDMTTNPTGPLEVTTQTDNGDATYEQIACYYFYSDATGTDRHHDEIEIKLRRPVGGVEIDHALDAYLVRDPGSAFADHSVEGVGERASYGTWGQVNEPTAYVEAISNGTGYSIKIRAREAPEDAPFLARQPLADAVAELIERLEA